ncbi:hypothetical protein SanaruYs_37100 [Chryseotalea sanaruensis]|uniref:Transposase IS200-like domain-containing protein n=1 Tax=Chryseotalea sanaruensis TaxID=2482724 RepID=A0A401UEZ1_9BACT|nr:transposase [Chryseotalea sanaruensis]GCC53466.1 hypothetical protein SanaruYs_37100 [Chryseotalea sanaruensis]
MAALFKNRYRIETTRLQSWNYANDGMYFVTTCTKNRKNYFGEIGPSVEISCMASLQMVQSEIGLVAHNEWYKTPELRPDMNLQLGEFVVMPNHIHGIIIIGKNEYNGGCRDAMHCVSTTTNAMHRASTESKNKFGPQSKNLASILRGYKSAVATYARKNNIEFDWQPLFHDHIIRSEEAYYRISNYIKNNPSKWAEDRFYTARRRP